MLIPAFFYVIISRDGVTDQIWCTKPFLLDLPKHLDKQASANGVGVCGVCFVMICSSSLFNSCIGKAVIRDYGISCVASLI